MDRRRFLKSVAASTLTAKTFSSLPESTPDTAATDTAPRGTLTASSVPVEGHTFLCAFRRSGEEWKVYEDLRTRDGSPAGKSR